MSSYYRNSHLSLSLHSYSHMICRIPYSGKKYILRSRSTTSSTEFFIIFYRDLWQYGTFKCSEDPYIWCCYAAYIFCGTFFLYRDIFLCMVFLCCDTESDYIYAYARHQTICHSMRIENISLDSYFSIAIIENIL